MNRPTLRQLEYLLAVADEGHFGRAAAACFVSQPGLSSQIKQLEELLEIQVFERDRRGVLVTAAGEEVVRRARRVLLEVDELGEAARVASRPLAGSLRIGVIPTVASYLLPKLLPKLLRRHRQLRPLLREDKTDRLVEALGEGHLDVLLLALEADLGHAATWPLFEDPFWVVVPAGHRFAKKKSIAEADLKGESILLLDDGHCLREQVLAACGSRRATELGDFRATSLGTLTQMVASGVAITLLPELSLPLETRGRRDLAVIPFRRPRPYRTIGLAWRKTSARAEEYRMLGESLVAVRAGPK